MLRLLSKPAKTSLLKNTAYTSSIFSQRSIQRAQSTEPPKQNFYQILDISHETEFKDADLHAAYNTAMETLSDKMGSGVTSGDHDLDDLMDEMMTIDKAYKVLRDPMTRRDYTEKLKAGKLDEIQDADSHYQDLKSDLGFRKFKVKNDAKKKALGEKSAKVPENITKKAEQIVGKAAQEADFKGMSGMLAENQRYVSYVWGGCLGVVLLAYAFGELSK